MIKNLFSESRRRLSGWLVWAVCLSLGLCVIYSLFYLASYFGVSFFVVLVNYNSSQLFTMQPNVGYSIAHVYVDSVDNGAISNYTFSNVQGNHTISVTTSIINFTIAASAGPNGTITPNGTFSVSYGQNQTFNFTADTGYHVSQVLVDNASKSIADSYTFSNVQKNYTINVSFAINTYKITTNTDAHLSVSPSNVTVSYGGNQTLNFNATQGYSFDVAVDGVSQGQIGNYTFSNVTASHSVNVTSALLNYTVSASADVGSTISPSGDVMVNYDGSQLFIIQNKTGYNVTHVYVDNVDMGAISNYTFSNVSGNHVITVSSVILSVTNSSTPTPTSSTTPTIVPSQSPQPTNSTSPTQTQQPTATPQAAQTNQFPTGTVLIAVIAALVALNAVLVFKKGYVIIQTVDDQENPQEEPAKEKKPEVSPYDEALDY